MAIDSKTDPSSVDFILSKTKSDLELLEHGRDAIMNQLEHTSDKKDFDESKLSKLNNSIERLKRLIIEFENIHSNDLEDK